MNQKAELKRRVFLKGQALKLIRAERQELRRRLFLLELRESLLTQMKQEFDKKLSQKVDCVDFLLREFGGEE